MTTQTIADATLALETALALAPRPWEHDMVFWLAGALQGITLALEAEQPGLRALRLPALEEESPETLTPAQLPFPFPLP